MANSFGRVTVPVPGTPVRVTTKTTKAHAIMFEALPGNVGKIFIGGIGLIKGSQQEIAILAAPSLNAGSVPVSIPTYSETISYAPAALNLADYWIDADNANEGVLISYLVG